MRQYNCYDIETVNKEVDYKNCTVFVPAIDLSTPEGRLENLSAISGALETFVGEIESFRYEEYTQVESVEDYKL
jgi:hypothetical protein